MVSCDWGGLFQFQIKDDIKAARKDAPEAVTRPFATIFQREHPVPLAALLKDDIKRDTGRVYSNRQDHCQHAISGFFDFDREVAHKFINSFNESHLSISGQFQHVSGK
ncbi:MAG: hypothetical protein IPQ16_06025 [Geobacteraceae bacterium]|nr:hypothetical protein [Geobacteraceae bacterium]